MLLTKFAFHKWNDFTNDSLHIRITRVSTMCKDFDDNPFKYFEILNEKLKKVLNI